LVRFGVVLSVVLAAFGLLAAGVVDGSLLLVVVSIGVAAVAFLMLAAVVLIWREEIFGTGAAHAQDRSARVGMTPASVPSIALANAVVSSPAVSSTTAASTASASTGRRVAEAPAAAALAPVLADDADQRSVPAGRETARAAKRAARGEKEAARAEKEAALSRRRVGRHGEPAGEPHSLADVFGDHSAEEPADIQAGEATKAARAAAVAAAAPVENPPARPVPTFRKAQSADNAGADAAVPGEATAGKAAEDGAAAVRTVDGGPARGMAAPDVAERDVAERDAAGRDAAAADVPGINGAAHRETASPAAATGKASGPATDSLSTAAAQPDLPAAKVSRQDGDWRDRFATASSLSRPAGDAADSAADRLRGDRDRDRTASPGPASRLERESARAARSVRDSAASGGAASDGAVSGGAVSDGAVSGRAVSGGAVPSTSGAGAAAGSYGPTGDRPAPAGSDARPPATLRTPAPDTPPPAVPASGAGAAPVATAGAAATRPASTLSSSAAEPGPAAGRESGPAADSEAAKPSAGAEPKAGQALSSSVRVVPGIARYHGSDCLLIRFLAPEDLEEMTREAAAAGGCVPCKACSPDQAAASVPVA
jgi:hypothetical protein